MLLAWAVLAYFGIGAGLALYSGTHPVFFVLLWPWAVAAQAVKIATGRYPPWSPPL